ncbi:MAG: ATP-binding protein [Bacteroidota bacterium]
MNVIAKEQSLLQRLQAFEVFEGIGEESLNWLIEKSDYCHYPKGEHIFFPGMKVDHMEVIVQGEYYVHAERNGRNRELGVWGTGQIAGVLPFSRMTEIRVYGTALEDTYTLRLHKECFVEMVNISYELTQKLVAVMSTRIRDFTQLASQDEKLLALGKLSAGLAHELNNPASAMVRSSEELYNQVHSSPEKFKRVMNLKITPEETDEINAILFSKVGENRKPNELSLLDKEEKTDEILDWLEDNGVEDPDAVAETFVEFGMEVEELEEIQDILAGKEIGAILRWLESTMNLDRLVEEIKESADRIATLVKAIKGYSYMDRSLVMEPTQVSEGLINTMMILKHKMKLKRIKVDKQFEEGLAPIMGLGGELNQVWTNIIANAIEAMGEDGTLLVRTYEQRGKVCVDITDDGPGIPEDIQNRIFEPFFTTKAMGQGTGIGLDIVKKILERHKADISVDSEPGRTTFHISFSIAPKIS